MQNMSEPRPLVYHNWSEVEHDLLHLLQGYQQLGNWNLSQASLHLSDWLRFTIEGYPVMPWPMRVVVSVVGKLIGPKLLKKTLEQGFETGTLTLPETVYTDTTLDEIQAVSQLMAAIRRFQSYAGELYASPLFGPLPREVVEQLQLLHMAHHLRLLIPLSEDGPSEQLQGHDD